jgi:hypothetical protein
MASGTAWQALGRQRAIISAFAMVEPNKTPFAIKNTGPIELSALGRGALGGGDVSSVAACLSPTVLGASGRDDSAATAEASESEGFAGLNAEATSRLPESARIEENVGAGAEVWAAAVPHIVSVNSQKPAFATCLFIVIGTSFPVVGNSQAETFMTCAHDSNS